MITGRPDFYMRKGVPVCKFFDPETKTCMQRMFSVLLQGERQIEKYREALAKRIYMDFHCAFLLIDTDRDDYISPAELRDFSRIKASTRVTVSCKASSIDSTQKRQAESATTTSGEV